MFTHRPLVGVVLCFACGIIGNQYGHLPFWFFAVAAFLLLAMSLVFLIDLSIAKGSQYYLFPDDTNSHKYVIGKEKVNNRNQVFKIFLFPAFIALGFLSSIQVQTLPWNHIQNKVVPYNRDTVFVEGVIISDVQKRTFGRVFKTVFTLQVKKWQPKNVEEGDRVSGKVLVNIFRDVELNYGDDVLIEGKLHPPFNFSAQPRFTYGEYLKQKGIQLILTAAKRNVVQVLASHQGNCIAETALDVRKKLKAVLTKHLSKNSAGIINALILGERYDISKNLKDLFVQTGTSHILAISGFNVGLWHF